MKKPCDCLVCEHIDCDWESSGGEDTNKIYEEIGQRTSICDVQDRLNNVLDLLKICGESLLHSEHVEIKKHVAHVLYFYVEKEISTAEEELNKV